LAHDYGALVHTDAVQAAGRILVDMQNLGVDLLTLSAHKLGGPQGVGALVLRGGVDIDPLVRGGGQELNRRAGTENTAGIVGFGVAAALTRDTLPDMDRVRLLRDRLEDGIRTSVAEAVIWGPDSDRVATTTCVSVAGVPADKQVMALDLEGICVSAGSACSSGKVTASPVLLAMGAGEDVARAAIRISLGWASRADDVDRFLDVWPRFIARMQVREAQAS
ncbi:MAG: aminotransferase class V-fold PLP-dependent enzyme, partial [Sphingomonadales bacterium]